MYLYRLYSTTYRYYVLLEFQYLTQLALINLFVDFRSFNTVLAYKSMMLMSRWSKLHKTQKFYVT